MSVRLLDDQVAVITGGSRGIGRAVASELARHGAKVIINYAGNHTAAEEVVAAIREAGGEALALQGNVSQMDDAEQLMAFALKSYGKIDILVNNAGITRDQLVMRMKDSDWDDVINTNLKGVFNCTKAVIRTMMKQRKGRIINMASVVALSGNAGQANYVAAKAGVIGLTKSNAKEFATRGITVNAVAPGFIETDMTADLGTSVREALIQQIPMGRLGAAEDIAKAVRFLASDDASYITGQVLTVDGGMVM